ncbi:MAG TPA: hypothetical protein VMS18_06225 [Candidatus Binatia bacterium]|nr:hypothetical protein [Candidatus Binatia bacterium]
MNSFQSVRVVHEYTQTNSASPERVFPLLCPVREADWIPGWKHKLIYSDSGVAELGCIFTTQDLPLESEKYTSRSNGRETNSTETTTWICTEYEPSAFRIAYVWIRPGYVATELWIRLTAGDDGKTHSHIRFRYTGLSPEGNRLVESYDRKWFESKMRGWETAINHYLTTGRMIPVGA